jgi:hypothetical protein
MRMPAFIALLAMPALVEVAKLRLVYVLRNSELLLAVRELAILITAHPFSEQATHCSLG